MKRREFLQGAAVMAAGVLAEGLAHSARAADSRIEVLLGEEIGTINPHIYGHFAEHLGGVVYDGIWVGENSKIPNTGGIRTALVDALKRIKAPVIRWPGGCFADSYDWRDGIGPRARRPKRTNFWADAPEWPKNAPTGPGKFETNHFGTNAEIAVRGGSVSAAQALVLSTPDVHAHNTFENPKVVQPHAEPAVVRSGVVSFAFPPASVTRLQITVA